MSAQSQESFLVLTRVTPSFANCSRATRSKMLPSTGDSSICVSKLVIRRRNFKGTAIAETDVKRMNHTTCKVGVTEASRMSFWQSSAYLPVTCMKNGTILAAQYQATAVRNGVGNTNGFNFKGPSLKPSSHTNCFTSPFKWYIVLLQSCFDQLFKSKITA